MSRKLKFVVITEEYTEGIGGYLVMHKLAEKLKLYDDEVIISTSKNSNVDKIDENKLNEYILICGETIDIQKIDYPFNKIQNVVRWVLYKLGHFSGYKGFYEKNEKVYTYAPFFTKNTIYENTKELIYFEPKIDIFYDFKKNRSEENLLLIKKGKHKLIQIEGRKLDEDIYIDNKHPLKLKDDIKDLDNFLLECFNNHKRFISYDTSSYHSVQAVLSGCISIVIPDEGVSKEEWQNKQPLLKYGVAYGFDDIEWAISTAHLVRPHLEEYYQYCMNTISDFRKDCLLNFPSDNFFSVVIQTRWHSLKIIKLLEKLENCQLVDEIILIDNNPKEKIELTLYKKVKYHTKDFLYPNESINLGVSLAENNLICLCDDSLEFDCEEIFHWILNNKSGLGCIGLSPKNFEFGYTYTGVEKVKNEQDLSKLIHNGFDKLVFFIKNNFIKIPGELKINYGIDWIAKTNKPTYSISSKTRVLSYKKNKESLVRHEEDYRTTINNDVVIWTKINQNL